MSHAGAPLGADRYPNRPGVLANLCWITPGGVGGSEDYTVRLLHAVRVHRPEAAELTVASLADLRPAHPALAGLGWEIGPGGAALRPVRVAVEATWLRWRARSHDLVHHFGGTVTPTGAVPSVVTIHDIQPLDLPHHFTRVKRLYLQRRLPAAVRAARLVTTPSDWVRERIVDRLGVPPDKVMTVPSTWLPEPARPDPIVDELEGDGVIVYPAMSHPHKDHQTLIAAFARLHRDRPGVRLVLTGGPGRAHDAVAALVAATDGVEHWGRVPAARLRALIGRADLVAFPSRYEGFGLPVLEAMASGTRVVAAAATALPEVVGRGGLLVPPGDVDAWVEALAAGLEPAPDPELDAVAERLDHYAPARAADRLVAAWARVLAAT